MYINWYGIYYMNLKTMIGYISSLDTACKKDPEFDNSIVRIFGILCMEKVRISLPDFL